MLFLDGTLLQNLEDGGIELTEKEKNFAPQATPRHLILFTIGATNLLTVGFEPKPGISFVHGDAKKIPSAQSC